MALKSLPILTEAEKDLAQKVKLSLQQNYQGKENVISNSKIVAALKAKNIQASDTLIRKIMNHLRLSGCPICSNSEGYWWAKNKQEILECIDALENRIEAQQTTLNQLKELYETTA